MSVEPDEDQLEQIMARAGAAGDGPVVMLNLHRYRDRDAYMRYGEVATKVLDWVGGRILWYTQASLTVVGGEDDSYDEVIAVWYPSVAAFTALATHPEILEARRDRAEGLERATLICCEPGNLA